MRCSSSEAIAYPKIMFKTVSEPILERFDASIQLVATQLKAIGQLLKARDEKFKARYEKLGVQWESLEAKIDAQNTKCNLLFWIAGVIGGIEICNLLVRMFGWSLGGG